MSRLLIDIGNSSVKAAVSADGSLCARVQAPSLTASLIAPLLERWHPTSVALSVVGDAKGLEAIPPALPLYRVSTQSPLPIAIDYDSPATLGADRIAAAVAANALAEGNACVVVDAGTCITVDFVDGAGRYRGGAIMPGLDMKFKALHNFTAKLPLLSSETLSADMSQIDNIQGRTTGQSIQAGVLAATRMALRAMVERYRQAYPSLRLFLTGGSAVFLQDAFEIPVRVETDLVLLGIDRCADYLPKAVGTAENKNTESEQRIS